MRLLSGTYASRHGRRIAPKRPFLPTIGDCEFNYSAASTTESIVALFDGALVCAVSGP